MNDQPLPELLEAPLDQVVADLLRSTIPARLAWVAPDGSPRVVPIWFQWTGTTLAMTTFSGSVKLTHLKDGDQVAITIDTDVFPYQSLKIRGTITLEPVDGLADEYRQAAMRYLGSELSAEWLAFLGNPRQTVISLLPAAASMSNMQRDSPFFG